MDSISLKPSWNALVIKPLIPTLTLGLLLTAVTGFVLPQLLLAPLVFFLFVAGLQFIWNQKKYSKTEYTLGEEKIRATSGTYFSDSDTELLWTKIVQPQLAQGFLQKLLFGTATIYLETAGQVGAEIVLSELDDFSGAFDEILSRLDVEVPLPDDTLRHEYRPDTGGMLLDLVLPLVFLTAVVGGIIFGGLQFVGLTGAPVAFYAVLATAAVVILVLPFSLYGYLKQSNTVYRFYQNHAVLDVNFMGLCRQVIPLDQLSDVTLNQPLHKRLIGLSSLGLSVPGMGDAFTMDNIAGADSIRNELKQLVRRLDGTDGASPGTSKRYESGPDFAGTMGVSLLVTGLAVLLSLGLFTLLPTTSGNLMAIGVMSAPAILAGLYLLYKWINYTAVSFAVEGDSVEYTFSFLSRDVTSLSTDKIKAIVKSQGILQRFFDVYTVSFYSIGTEDDVSFYNMKETDENEAMIRAIREREGSHGGEKQESVTPDFSFPGLIFQDPLALLIPSGAGLLPGIVLGLTGLVSLAQGIVWGVAGAALFSLPVAFYLNFYYLNYVSLDLFPDYLMYREGLFFTKEHYVIYDDIRNVEHAQEPLGSGGWIKVDYAGGGSPIEGDDEVTSQGEFHFAHLGNVSVVARNLEEIFSGNLEPARVKAEREDRERGFRDETKQTIKPSHVPYILQGVFYALVLPVFFASDLPLNLLVYGGGALVPLGAIGGFIYPKTISYTIKENQVERSQWILLTRTKSVKYENIDNIDMDRGLMDKIFGTGRVNVSTTGGGGVELQAKYIRDHESFYENLQAEYNEARTDNQ